MEVSGRAPRPTHRLLPTAAAASGHCHCSSTSRRRATKMRWLDLGGEEGVGGGGGVWRTEMFTPDLTTHHSS
ncbi:hypothetical protein Taro_012860 [Colocasia esculenta]|uniref:Uncharacterized protein n=1 Tax=Colocasia esculenta TaxID=4460 RepID=A0A843UAB4_COLES|nr:hypothetical protein [Colocasia esculenta]